MSESTHLITHTAAESAAGHSAATLHLAHHAHHHLHHLHHRLLGALRSLGLARTSTACGSLVLGFALTFTLGFAFALAFTGFFAVAGSFRCFVVVDGDVVDGAAIVVGGV